MPSIRSESDMLVETVSNLASVLLAKGVTPDRWVDRSANYQNLEFSELVDAACLLSRAVTFGWTN